MLQKHTPHIYDVRVGGLYISEIHRIIFKCGHCEQQLILLISSTPLF